MDADKITTEQIEFNGERPKMISYFEHEIEMARSELHSFRWMVAALVAFVAFILSNVCWIVYENQFEDTVTVTQEAETGDAPIYQNGTGELSIDGQGTADSN